MWNEPITLKQAADLLDLSQAQISRLIADEWIGVDKATGKTTAKLAATGYIASIKEGRNTADIDLKVLKGKLSAQQFDHREGKYRQEANAEALVVGKEMGVFWLNFLDGLAAQVTRIPETRKRIEDAVFNHKKKFVVMLEKLAIE